MSFQWLWLLWPIVGFLCWGWMNYNVQDNEGWELSTSPVVNVIDALVYTAIAPVTFDLAVLAALCKDSSHRWGLKFG